MAAEVGRETGKDGGCAVVFGVFAFLRISTWALRYLGAGSLMENLIRYPLAFAVFVLLLRWLHRWGARQDLRRKLLERGIPVCIGCGYSLRGLTEGHRRCPECGRDIDERVRAIMRASDGKA